MALKWIDLVDNVDTQSCKPVNEIAHAVLQDEEEIKQLKKLTINETSFLNSLETNKIYNLTTESAQIVGLPSVDAAHHNQILVYLQTTAQISVIWGNDIAFVNDEIPTIGIGCYRIIFEFNPLLDKWVVGVIQDGVVA